MSELNYSNDTKTREKNKEYFIIQGACASGDVVQCYLTLNMDWFRNVYCNLQGKQLKNFFKSIIAMLRKDRKWDV